MPLRTVPVSAQIVSKDPLAYFQKRIEKNRMGKMKREMSSLKTQLFKPQMTVQREKSSLR